MLGYATPLPLSREPSHETPERSSSEDIHPSPETSHTASDPGPASYLAGANPDKASEKTRARDRNREAQRRFRQRQRVCLCPSASATAESQMLLQAPRASLSGIPAVPRILHCRVSTKAIDRHAVRQLACFWVSAETLAVVPASLATCPSVQCVLWQCSPADTDTMQEQAAGSMRLVADMTARLESMALRQSELELRNQARICMYYVLHHESAAA